MTTKEEHAPVVVVGAGPGRAHRRDRPRARGNRDAAPGAQGPHVAGAAGQRGQHVDDGADALVGARRAGSRGRPPGRAPAVAHRDARDGAPRARRRRRLPDARAERPHQPDRPGRRGPGATSSRSSRATCAHSHTHASNAGRRSFSSRTAHDGVILTVRDIASGAERVVRARYLIAADGVRSTVRRALGITASRSQELEARLSVLFRAPLWELLGDHRYAIYFITGAERSPVFVPSGLPDRWVFATEWDSDPEQIAALDHSEVTRWIREAAGDHTPRARDRERRGRAVRDRPGRALPGRPRLPDR